jgi:pimeloyl-ACP methyl ester carboxylesterase
MSSIRKGYVDTPDGQAHFRRAGREDAPRVLLLHQTASSSAMYEALMERLAGDYCLFAPDTPGYGATFFPPATATIEYYAQAMWWALDAVGWRECFVFGHHTGASVAVEMEHQRPGLARKMILSGPPYLSEEQKANFRAGVQPIVVQEDGAHASALWARLRAKDPQAPLALTHREFVLNLRAGERYHETYHAVFTHDFNARLAALDCPTLVMAGDADTLRAALEPAYRALKRGEIRYLTGNTYVCDRDPDAVAAVVREFFV